MRNQSELNFRTRPVGETSEQGVIDVCPVCNELAARRTSKALNSTLFVHTMIRKPGLGDLVASGSRWVDGGTGRWSIGEFHMATADGQPVMPAVRQVSNIDVDRGWKSFYNNHCDTKKIAQMIDLDLEATPQTRKAKAKAAPVKPVVREVPEWRRLAAQKAWEKIRANRAAAQQSAVAA